MKNPYSTPTLIENRQKIKIFCLSFLVTDTRCVIMVSNVYIYLFTTYLKLPLSPVQMININVFVTYRISKKKSNIYYFFSLDFFIIIQNLLGTILPLLKFIHYLFMNTSFRYKKNNLKTNIFIYLLFIQENNSKLFYQYKPNSSFSCRMISLPL